MKERLEKHADFKINPMPFDEVTKDLVLFYWAYFAQEKDIILIKKIWKLYEEFEEIAQGGIEKTDD